MSVHTCLSAALPNYAVLDQGGGASAAAPGRARAGLWPWEAPPGTARRASRQPSLPGSTGDITGHADHAQS